MKIHKEFWLSSSLIVLRINVETLTISLLNELIEELKKDFPKIMEEKIIVKNFTPPEYRFESWGLCLKCSPSDTPLLMVPDNYVPK